MIKPYLFCYTYYMSMCADAGTSGMVHRTEHTEMFGRAWGVVPNIPKNENEKFSRVKGIGPN